MNQNELVDIRTVIVDRSLSQSERVAEYVRQIRNPRRFMCGGFTVTAIYPEDAPPIEDRLRGAIL